MPVGLCHTFGTFYSKSEFLPMRRWYKCSVCNCVCCWNDTSDNKSPHLEHHLQRVVASASVCETPGSRLLRRHLQCHSLVALSWHWCFANMHIFFKNWRFNWTTYLCALHACTKVHFCDKDFFMLKRTRYLLYISIDVFSLACQSTVWQSLMKWVTALRGYLLFKCKKHFSLTFLRKS